MKELSLEEVEKLIIINRSNLETELERQPEILMRVAEECVRRISIRDELKEDRDRIWAEEFLKAKNTPTSDGKTPSDKVAEVIADSSAIFKGVTKAFLEAKRDAEIWWAKREAFQARTDCLKELGRIKATGIYSLTSVVSENEKERKYEDIKKKMRRE